MPSTDTKKSKNKLDFVKLTRLYKVFSRHYRKQWKLLALAGIGLLGSIATTLLQPWPLKLILDHIILEKPLPAEASFLTRWFGTSTDVLLLMLALSVIVITLFDAMLSYVHRFYLAAASQKIVTDVRERVFAHLQRLSLSFHNSSQSGDVVYRLTSDVKDLRLILVDAPLYLLERLLSIGSIVVVIMALDWRLALIAFGIVPVLFSYTLCFGADVKKAKKRKKQKESQVASIVSENITAMALVQAYGQEETEKARFDQQNVASVQAEVSAIRLSKVIKRINDVLIALGTAAMVYFGARYVLSGAILPGTLVVFVTYLKKLYGPIDKFSMTMVDLAKSQVSGERIMELVENDTIVKDAPDARPAPELMGRVEFRNVGFAYKEDVDVIRNLSFVAEPGQTVALVGPSGAGKSTLISLLLRFYDPDQGQILIDGHDIREFKLKSLREQITIVFQDAVLLRKTIRENIAFGNPNATDEEIVEAAKLAQAHNFIMQLPEGYETLVWEGGENLSGGQKQRTCISRAILRNSPILILDEPSTGLDAKAEAKVSQAIHHLTQGKTTFVIAHKFSTIINADKILVLEEGGIAQEGTHEELMRTSPRYHQLYELQF